jgi:hypothetical protein
MLLACICRADEVWVIFTHMVNELMDFFPNAILDNAAMKKRKNAANV